MEFGHRSIYLPLMKFDWTAFAERSCYRPASLALMLASCLALASVLVGFPGWLCLLVAAASSIALTVITYHRLRNAECSGAWVVLMILQFDIGPTWHPSDSLTIAFGGYIIGCVPVILGWFAPANFGAKPKS